MPNMMDYQVIKVYIVRVLLYIYLYYLLYKVCLKRNLATLYCWGCVCVYGGKVLFIIFFKIFHVIFL